MAHSIGHHLRKAALVGRFGLILGRTRNAGRGLATPASPQMDEGKRVTVDVHPFKGHRVEPPPTQVETSREELMGMFRLMNVMRRCEMTADMLYKQKLIRGFLHLADGQEAVPVGMEAALDFQDSIIQSYRDHTTFLGRGGTVKELYGELFGKVEGCARGLGGSMHLYKKEHNFYGGMGIVGTQVPLGAGVALGHMYRNDGHVCFTMYGDGAANQGQVAETYNLAALWKLPMVFGIENNHFGMGTADTRASKSFQYYTRGDYIPGLWVDGMDVLAVRAACSFAKQYVLEQGPLVIEFDTYRYHGHSISDPGSTYRTRDEIQAPRDWEARRAYAGLGTPLNTRTLLQENNLATAQELKQLEKSIKQEVQDAVEEAKLGKEPPIEDLWNNVYKDGLGATMRPIQMGRPRIPV